MMSRIMIKIRLHFTTSSKKSYILPKFDLQEFNFGKIPVNEKNIP